MVGNDGQYALGDTTAVLAVQCVSTTSVATAPDSAPTYKIVDSTGTTLLSGNFSGTDVTGLTGLRQTSALSLTTANGFASGKVYEVIKTFTISSVVYTRHGRLLVT